MHIIFTHMYIYVCYYTHMCILYTAYTRTMQCYTCLSVTSLECYYEQLLPMSGYTHEQLMEQLKCCCASLEHSMPFQIIDPEDGHEGSTSIHNFVHVL